MMQEHEKCRPGRETHRWPQHIDKCYGIEMYHCDFCGDDWEEDEGERLQARGTR